MDSSNARRRVDALLVQLAATRKRVQDERDALAALDARLIALAEAQALAQHVAQQIQTRAHVSIAKIVTKCLAIFDEPYTFRILFDRKRGKTEARLVFERDGMEVDPLTASGGGVVDVAAFALRIACLVLARPQLRRVLILDEPFRFVSPEYRHKVRELLISLATDMGIQFLIVTHDPQLRAGKIIEL